MTPKEAAIEAALRVAQRVTPKERVKSFEYTLRSRGYKVCEEEKK